MDLSFGVAGPGRVGMSLAKAFASAGLSCAGVYGGTHAKARAAELGVRHFNEPLGLVAAADVIFICVPDRFINEAAESMAKAAAQAGLDVCGKYFYHVSGSAGLDELAPLKALGAETGSLHPLQSFAAPVKSLAGIGMAVDGSAKAQELGFKLARLSGAAAFKVPQKERALYHAAACFCSNFTVTVTALAEKLLLRWTEDEETAHSREEKGGRHASAARRFYERRFSLTKPQLCIMLYMGIILSGIKGENYERYARICEKFEKRVCGAECHQLPDRRHA